MLRWYLIRTKPSAEALAQANLNRQGYEIYLPRTAVSVRRSARWHKRIVPLFPRYLFLRLNEGCQPLHPVQSTPGVACVVRFGSLCTIVPDRVIRDLRARADPASGLHRLTSPPDLVPGAPVRISEGPFDGLAGVFERAAGAERVVVLLRLLGQNASVCVPLDSLIPVHAFGRSQVGPARMRSAQ